MKSKALPGKKKKKSTRAILNNIKTNIKKIFLLNVEELVI